MDKDRETSLEERRRALDAELAARAPVAKPQDNAEGNSKPGYAQAVKLSSEFIAGIAVGILLGYGFDYVAGTKPWGMIIFLLLGFCAAILNVLRSMGVVAPAEARKRDESKK